MRDSIQAILFDLDGTLLSNNMDIFLPHYFELLGSRMAHIMPPKPFLARLMRATRAMIANDGRATNQEVFAKAFYPVNGHSREEVEPLFLDFYANDFSRLRRYAQRKPEARRIVQLAFDVGLDVVIATNPVFPAVAVYQRLAWADVDDFPYDLVTAYENSRATKPNLLYFEHVLESVGHPPEATLVVGDEDMDMVAAHLGCRTFLVPGPRSDLAETTPLPTYQGTLTELETLLQVVGS
jgi:FMN phosphatase YigB (HAD superfamily)